MPYLVIDNMPGYLPESEPDECDTLREAFEIAMWRKDLYRQCGHRVEGNIRADRCYYIYDDDLDEWANGAAPLRVIEITEGEIE